MFNKRLIPIPGREFLNTPEEWHALWVGCFEVMCPWRPRIAVCTAQLGYIQTEYHYYLMGRVIGAAILVFSLLGIAALVRACW